MDSTHQKFNRAIESLDTLAAIATMESGQKDACPLAPAIVTLCDDLAPFLIAIESERGEQD